jgi:peptide/nickel transport system substrate-binding protein
VPLAGRPSGVAFTRGGVWISVAPDSVPYAGTPRHPDLYMSGWQSDYPGAANFIEPQFACGAAGFGNPSGWCSKTLDAEIDRALALSTTDPGAANRAWTEIEHQLVEDAAQAPITNPVTTQAVSARVGNVQVNPQWGILLSRLWVK